MSFYSIKNNTLSTRGYPWISKIISGLQDRGSCPACDARLINPCGELHVLFERRKGTKWPSILGCGHFPLFVVSSQVIAAWRQEGIEELPIAQVHIVEPYPRRLEDTTPPDYFWIDGSRLRGARLEFEKSGFVGVQFCQKCGRRWDDIGATYDRQHEQVWPYEFCPGSWNGADLFTTDLSPAAFFCTERIVQISKQQGHSNFRFVPIEEGAGLL